MIKYIIYYGLHIIYFIYILYIINHKWNILFYITYYIVLNNVVLYYILNMFIYTYILCIILHIIYTRIVFQS